MSAIARWSYKYPATVRPYVGMDMVTGATTYGPEFDILCNVTAVSEMARESGGARGNEFVSQHVIYTEDARPKYKDQISFVGSNGWEEIRAHTMWDMAAFDDVPDYKMVT